MKKEFKIPKGVAWISLLVFIVVGLYSIFPLFITLRLFSFEDEAWLTPLVYICGLFTIIAASYFGIKGSLRIIKRGSFT